MWSHPDSGYLMSPELCARIADIPNIVAIKYSVPREMYVALTRMAADKLIVSTASEDEWFDNIVELNWQVYLCSNPPFLYQTAEDRRMRDYTDLAMRGDIVQATRRARQPRSRPLGFQAEPPARQTARAREILAGVAGQTGGAVRRPMLEFTEAEKAATRDAFAASGLGHVQRAAAE